MFSESFQGALSLFLAYGDSSSNSFQGALLFSFLTDAHPKRAFMVPFRVPFLQTPILWEFLGRPFEFFFHTRPSYKIFQRAHFSFFPELFERAYRAPSRARPLKLLTLRFINPFFQIPFQTDPFFRLLKPIVVLPVDKVVSFISRTHSRISSTGRPVSAMFDREILITFAEKSGFFYS